MSASDERDDEQDGERGLLIKSILDMIMPFPQDASEREIESFGQDRLIQAKRIALDTMPISALRRFVSLVSDGVK